MWSSCLVVSKWQEVPNDDQLKAVVDLTPPNDLTYIYSACTISRMHNIHPHF